MSDKPDLQAHVWDTARATDEQWVAASTLWNRIRSERMPEDPLDAPETTRARLSSIPSFIDHRFWVVWHPERSEMLAYGLAIVLLTGENEHITQMEICVLPEWRRQGIGTQLLGLVTGLAREKGKRLLITQSWGSVPVAGIFCAAPVSRSAWRATLTSSISMIWIARWLASG